MVSGPCHNGDILYRSMTTGNGTLPGAVLVILGKDAATNNVSYYQTSGTTDLTNNAGLYCDYNYYQSGGTLQSDATACEIGSGSEGNNGDINIAGGTVTIDTVANTVSSLSFLSSTVEFNGSLVVNGLMTGGNSISCDRLICNGSITFGANSSLTLGTTGAGQLGTGNQWAIITYSSESGSFHSYPNWPPGQWHVDYDTGQLLIWN